MWSAPAAKWRCSTELILRFGYGAIVPWVTRLEDGALRAIAGPDMVVLRTPVHLRGADMTTVGEFTINKDDTIPFVLSYLPSHLPMHAPLDPTTALDDTETFWQDWSAKCRPAGPWSDAVLRSMITLKALTYAPTGGMVAAPTTSLPEQLGGERNWDYRYCWLRDATLVLLGAMNAGYFDEAQAWREWLLRAVAGSPGQLQIMYGIAGERRLTEWAAPWLPGYENSAPVRIGNAAHSQLQLDVFGEIMDVHHQARRARTVDQRARAGRCSSRFSNICKKIWNEPDEGIWEVRGAPRHFTHSKVMAWVAFDRAIKSAETFGLEGPLDEWRTLREEICEEVCTKGFDPELGTFVQSYRLQAARREPVADAECRLPAGVRSAHGGTIAAIERRLLHDGFVMRYDTRATDDGLPPGEGAFLACSFWLADVYIAAGPRRRRRAIVQPADRLRNDVGLLSEEYDPRVKRLVGNFPQAFSHMALVNSAYNLTRIEKPLEQRAQPEYTPPDEVAAE